MSGKKAQNHSHAWRGSWDRPMHIDEDGLDPFTVARMTDHNVGGVDDKQARARKTAALPAKGKRRKAAG